MFKAYEHNFTMFKREGSKSVLLSIVAGQNCKNFSRRQSVGLIMHLNVAVCRMYCVRILRIVTFIMHDIKLLHEVCKSYEEVVPHISECY
jgi:hypothetical protein